MVKATIAGKPMGEILDCAGRFRATRTELFQALQPGELSTKHLFVLTEVMTHIEPLEAMMARFECALLDGLTAWQPQLVVLQTIQGIDAMGAAMLLVEIGPDMAHFSSAQRLASWGDICPGNNESVGKRKSGRTRKGNAWMRRLLCEFAQAAAHSRCAFKDKFSALTILKGHRKSIVALGHRILCPIYAMLTDGTHDQDRTIDYEALSVQRNTSRWIKMLVKHGFIPAVS